MKKLLLLIGIVLISCSKESDGQNKDITLFQSTTFVSEMYMEEQPDYYGATIPPQERRNVIMFGQGGHILFFKVDSNSDTVSNTSSVTGSYKLDFPKVYDITSVSIFTETQLTVQTGGIMKFTAGGLTYTQTEEEF